MKMIAATMLSVGLALPFLAHAQSGTNPASGFPRVTTDDVRSVAPALEHYTQKDLFGDVWKRPGLAPRDRSVVTLAALIARNQTIEMLRHLNLALDNGVKPREISEIITHLAFYSGWANAMSAVAVAKDIFAERKIGLDQLPAASPSLLTPDEACGGAARKARQRAVRRRLAGDGPEHDRHPVPQPVASSGPRAARPQPRHGQRPDRHGQVAQIPVHLNRAMDHGLTQDEAAEAITHLAFYVGWPNVFSAMPVAKEVFEKRPRYGVRPSSRTGGEPTIDQGAGPCRSKAMARHRIHSLAFKKQVVQEYAAGATLNALAREHDLSRTLIRIWIAKCESGEFDPDVEAATLLGDYEAKIATLERMVGRQAVEIEFLKGALQQGRSPRSAPMSVIAGPAVSPSLKDAG